MLIIGVPKRNVDVSFKAGARGYILHAQHIRFRSGERSARKFKQQKNTALTI